MSTTQQHSDTIRHLREFADWLEAHPMARTDLSGGDGIYDYQLGRDAFIERARALDAGEWDQEITGESLMLIRRWGTLSYRLYTSLKCVCEEHPVEEPATEWVLSPSVLEEMSTQDCMDQVEVPDEAAREIELAEFATEREREECRS